MNQIAASKDRALAVAGPAGFVAAGVDEGVEASEKIIGKNKIFHESSFQMVIKTHEYTTFIHVYISGK